MLSENIKRLRKAKGLSQEELAVKLNVVRQTVSKWEQGLSVPDADLLIKLSEAFEAPVSTLLGEAPEVTEADSLKAISEKSHEAKVTNAVDLTLTLEFSGSKTKTSQTTEQNTVYEVNGVYVSEMLLDYTYSLLNLAC